jgi:hypothetical protein
MVERAAHRDEGTIDRHRSSFPVQAKKMPPDPPLPHE